jgi:hypothetical protein
MYSNMTLYIYIFSHRVSVASFILFYVNSRFTSYFHSGVISKIKISTQQVLNRRIVKNEKKLEGFNFE